MTGGTNMRFTIILTAILALAPAALGHHSDAGLDTDTVVTFEGTVGEVSWRNPHVYFTVVTANERGEPVEWTLQMGSTITSARRGWTADTLVSGDRVTVHAHPAHDGRPYGLMDSVEKEGGLQLSAAPAPAADVSARATSLEGIWRADTSRLISYPGGFDGFFLANLELTELGEDAMQGYDPLSPENPEAQCIGRPTPAMIVSTGLYPIHIQFNEDLQTISLRTEFWDEHRTVYMDGREHPDSSVRFADGHSIGWWEGETLVVDTRNFSDHRSPYQIGVPSGAQKHVVERYTLIEDGARVLAEFTLEDPEYMAEPLTHTRELIYSPHMALSPFDCDPEQTRRFLR